MKYDKKLKDIADDSIKNLSNSESKEKILAQQQINIDHDKESRIRYSLLRKQKIFLTIAASFVLLVIVISCAIFIPSSQKEDIPFYAQDNEMAYPSDLNAINKILRGYKIKDEYINKISLVKDLKSGDELYYILIWENDAFKSCRIDFVVNKYYEYVKVLTDEKTVINGLTIESYLKSKYYETEGIYVNERFASTSIGDVRIYFNCYESWTLTQDDEFEDFINEIFIKV